ncbi:MAG: thioredoxin domain-containing protein [Planctomycetota bacterium]
MLRSRFALSFALLCALTSGLFFVDFGSVPPVAAQPAASQPSAADKKPNQQDGGWRLAKENSEYLRMHATNPVEWYPWGEEAFARARELQRPVLLSIGYASCHWCHVMRREAFSDAGVAQYLNKHFVSIKVDREDLPHVDDVYMAAVQTITGQGGGWPLTAFLTPEKRPFFGGTYFPIEAKYGQPGFQELLTNIMDVWTNRRQEITDASSKITAQLKDLWVPVHGHVEARAFLQKGVATAAANFDPTHGGARGPAKFPEPRLLMLFGALSVLEDRNDLQELALTTLRQMARGGIVDQVGGGFHRYSVDPAWRVPHFEKMLYSQGLNTEAYLELYRFTGQDDLAQTARQTLDAMLRDFALDEGGFAASWDADTGEEEGTFYLWTPKQVLDVVGDERIAQQLCLYLGITEEGNFEGKRSVPYRAATVSEISQQLAAPPDVVRINVRSGIAKLLAARAKREAPLRDDKCILGWNALAVSALARGAVVLSDGRYAQAAEKALAFADRHLALATGFKRRWANGSADHPATLRDCALHLRACLDTYEATFDPKHVARAREIAAYIIAQHGPDKPGLFYETPAGVDVLVNRRRVIADDALPSGNSVLARSLLRLHGLTRDKRYLELAAGIIEEAMPQLESRPHLAPELLLAVLQHTTPTPQIAVTGDRRHPMTHALLGAVLHGKIPFAVVAQRQPGKVGERAATMIPLLEDRPAIGQRPTAYLCLDFVCKKPLSDARLFAEALQAAVHTPRKAPVGPKPETPESTTRPTSQPK